MYSGVMLVVQDVEKSSAWYQELLEAESGHGGPHFEMIMKDGKTVLMLHHSGIREHTALAEPTPGEGGKGVLVYLHAGDEVEAVHERAVGMGANVFDEPHVNPEARQFEFSLRDPDGYALTIFRPAAA